MISMSLGLTVDPSANPSSLVGQRWTRGVLASGSSGWSTTRAAVEQSDILPPWSLMLDQGPSNTLFLSLFFLCQADDCFAGPYHPSHW